VCHPGRRALGRMASGATCVQRLDDSRDFAIHTKYRISLRSSSMRDVDRGVKLELSDFYGESNPEVFFD
jgi:hypothetical protein